jgi:hypothetical protein
MRDLGLLLAVLLIFSGNLLKDLLHRTLLHRKVPISYIDNFSRILSTIKSPT